MDIGSIRLARNRDEFIEKENFILILLDLSSNLHSDVAHSGNAAKETLWVEGFSVRFFILAGYLFFHISFDSNATHLFDSQTKWLTTSTVELLPLFYPLMSLGSSYHDQEVGFDLNE